jgi:hypothetical protein
MSAICTEAVQVAPPSSEVKARMPLAPLKPSYGTTTRPLGCTTDTTVEPQENVSGSTSVACAAVGRLFCRERVGADLGDARRCSLCRDCDRERRRDSSCEQWDANR